MTDKKSYLEYLLLPASVLMLSLGCTSPVVPTEDGSLGDTDVEEADEASDALLAWEDAGEDEDWSPVDNIEAQSVPSVEVVNGVPHMAFVDTGNQCRMSVYTNTGWGNPTIIPGCAGPIAPSLAVLNNRLSIGFVGAGGGCFLNSYDGLGGWGRPFGLAGCGGGFAPALTGFGGALNVVYGGVGGGLYHTTCGLGGGCGGGVLIRGITTVVPPALGAWDGGLTLAYTGLNRQVFYSNYGLRGVGWGAPIGLPGVTSVYGPSLGYFGNNMYLGHMGLLGGYGYAPFLGRGLGLGGFHTFGSPFLRGPGAFGYSGLGLGRRFGAFSPYGGRLYWRGIGGGLGRRGWGRFGF